MGELDIYSMVPDVNFAGASSLIMIAGVLIALVILAWKKKYYKLAIPFPVKCLILEKHGTSIIRRTDSLRLIENKNGDKYHQFKFKDVEIDPITYDKFTAPNFLILYCPNRNTYIPLTINQADNLLEGQIDEGTMNALIRRNEKTVMRYTWMDWSNMVMPVMLIMTVLIIGVVFVMIGDSVKGASQQLAMATSQIAHANIMWIDFMNKTYHYQSQQMNQTSEDGSSGTIIIPNLLPG